MTRDYVRWHDEYDDPASSLSWRLARVRDELGRALGARAGAVRILSACAGDGRDVIGVLNARADAERVHAVLLELHPDIANAARAAAVGLDVEVRTVDAGTSDSYGGAVPADVVLLVGIFGNISDDDIRTTIRTAPQFCLPGATLLWSRSFDAVRIALIRREFADAGFVETALHVHDDGPTLGVVRYDGPPAELVPGRTLFGFFR